MTARSAAESTAIVNGNLSTGLVTALTRHVDAVAASLTGQLPSARAHSTAVAFVYTTALAAWAEDHGLIDPYLRSAPPPGVLPEIPGAAMRVRAAYACAALTVHPATECLLDPRYSPIGAAPVPEKECADLVHWWATDAPSLRFDVTAGPASISGWIVGDLLQALSSQRRKDHALVQTPWWVVDAILDLTLVAAAAESREPGMITAIDPTCGTGHFLIRTVSYLYELYTTGSLPGRQVKSRAAGGLTPVTPAAAIRHIVEGVDGVELDPLTAAVARLRFVVAIGALLHDAGLLPVLRLDRIPRWVRPRVVVGDSLLLGMTPPEKYAKLRPEQAAIHNPRLSDADPSGHSEFAGATP